MNIDLSREELKSLRDFLAWARTCEGCKEKEDQNLFNCIYRIDYALGQPMYVNVYHVSRHYGGPEEGGWWYNIGEVVESVEASVDKADEMKETLIEKHKEENEGDIYSVLGGIQVNVCVEDEPGQNYPAETPHYE